MKKEVLEKLNTYAIDWCYQCASHAYREKDKKHQSFTFDLIQFARTLDPKSDYGFFGYEIDAEQGCTFMLRPGKLAEFDRENKYKKGYYKGLFPILEEHLKNCGDDKIRRFKVYINKENNDLSVHID